MVGTCCKKVIEKKKYINELIIIFDVLQGFFADSMLGGCNLNQQADAEEYDAQMLQDNVANGFADGPQSVVSGNASNAAEEAGEEITS